MNYIILSGGSGKRLWPLSNESRSKQFIKFFKNENNEYESMIQKVFKSLKMADENAKIVIATSADQVSILKNQLCDTIDVSIEPCRRDTFPAIALAAAYMHEKKKIGLSETVIVCPVDPYVDLSYFVSIKRLPSVLVSENTILALMGIAPTYPSEKYGYIVPKDYDEISNVQSFIEKPQSELAQRFISEGALWNSGVFAFKLGYILDKARELLGYGDYANLYNHYHELKKISFDYAVVESEESICVLRHNGTWKDLGTWNTLTESINEKIVGNGIVSDSCENVSIVNELDIPILAMGLKDVIISASPEGVLVTDKNQSSFIKPYVDQIDQKIRYAEKSWGSYRVLNVEQESVTIKATLKAGHAMNYHSHQKRDEVWNVLSGSGVVCLDGDKLEVTQGNIINIKAGQKHSISAVTELKIIEVQIGKDISVEDKQIHEMI